LLALPQQNTPLPADTAHAWFEPMSTAVQSVSAVFTAVGSVTVASNAPTPSTPLMLSPQQ
jgi:hypothetical protein